MLARCGVATQLMACIGQDERGEFVQQALSQESVQLELISLLQHQTDLSLIYTDAKGENSIVTTVAAAQRVCRVPVPYPLNSRRLCRWTPSTRQAQGNTYLGTALASAILRHCMLDVQALHHAAEAAAITVSRFGTRSAFPDADVLASLLAEV